ncbi:MAG TPA: hypothetical protein VFR87_08925 [Nocardioidaceae bacterium]|nr:hypothetical protein [Nocardioidaceae bacterium]
MSTLYPHSGSDLALAPVLILIERNLEMLRSAEDVVFELALELNDIESLYQTPESRAERIVRAVTRNVNLHGLEVAPSPDLAGVTVSHKEYRVSLMLGTRLNAYVRLGARRPLATV